MLATTLAGKLSKVKDGSRVVYQHKEIRTIISKLEALNLEEFLDKLQGFLAEIGYYFDEKRIELERSVPDIPEIPDVQFQ
jgi:hypothetical protein